VEGEVQRSRRKQPYRLNQLPGIGIEEHIKLSDFCVTDGGFLVKYGG
jgi:hypothetical protein